MTSQDFKVGDIVLQRWDDYSEDTYSDEFEVMDVSSDGRYITIHKVESRHLYTQGTYPNRMWKLKEPRKDYDPKQQPFDDDDI